MTVTHATKVDRGSETGTFDSATEETNTYLTAYYVATIAIIKMFPHCVVQLFRNREYVGYRSHGNNLWCKRIGTHGFHIIFITKILYYLLNYKLCSLGNITCYRIECKAKVFQVKKHVKSLTLLRTNLSPQPV